MVFWCIIIALLAIATIVLFIVSPKCYSEVPLLLACVFAFCTFIGGAATLCSRSEYIEFERAFEIQRETVAFIEQTQSPETLYYVADIGELNAELAKWQACYETYGIFCTVPDRVLDIMPIGVSQ
jgi:hypothetical protein